MPSANFSPDGKQIVSTSGDNNLKLWDLAGNCLQTFVGHTYIGIVFSDVRVAQSFVL
jgi:WD40 repeat protein